MRWMTPAAIGATLSGAAFSQSEVAPTRDVELRNVSGLAPAGEGLVLSVADAKVDSARDRFVLVEAATGRPAALAVEWGDFGSTNDLEALCAIPGIAGEFLAVESGASADPARGGFAYRVRLDGGEGQEHRLTCLARYSLPDELREADPAAQIEGAAAFVVDDRVMVILGERVSGDLFVAELGEGGFGPARRQRTDHLPAWRGRRVAELCLVEGDGGWWLLSVQADDPGDGGPFGSTIVRLAWVMSDGTVLLGDGAVVAMCDGLKVEGLCVPAGGGPGDLLLGTDDEDFGAVVRPLRLELD